MKQVVYEAGSIMDLILDSRVQSPVAPSLFGRGYWHTLVIQLPEGSEVTVGGMRADFVHSLH